MYVAWRWCYHSFSSHLGDKWLIYARKKIKIKISFGSVKMPEKRASSTLKIWHIKVGHVWQNTLLEKVKKKEKDVHKSRLMKQKNRILKADGNLIKAEIQEQIYTNEYYLSIADIAAMNLIRRYWEIKPRQMIGVRAVLADNFIIVWPILSTFTSDWIKTPNGIFAQQNQ